MAGGTEPFTGNGPLSATWAAPSGTAFTRQTSQAGPVTTANTNIALITGVTFTPTQFAQITLGVLPPADGSRIFIILRGTANGSTRYFVSLNATGYSIYKTIGYIDSIIGAAHSQTFAASDVVRIETETKASTNYFRLYRNGTQLIEVDVGADHANGTIGGGFYTAGTNLSARFDDFVYGDLSRTLTVTTQSVPITASTVNLAISRALTVSTHSVPIVAQTVGLSYSRRITVTTHDVPIISTYPTLTYTRKIQVASASIPITASPVVLKASRKLAVQAASVPIVAAPVGLTRALSLSVTTASIPIAQADVGLRVSRSIAVASASVPVAFSPVNIGISRTLTVQTHNVPVTFNQALIVKGEMASFAEMQELSTGVLANSPYEFNRLGAGTWLFGIVMQDSSGIESLHPKFITVELSQPRITDLLFWQDSKADGWPGATSDVEPISGILLPQSIPYVWSDLTTWDDWKKWSPLSDTNLYTAAVIDTGSVQPLNIFVDANTVETAILKIENRTSNDGTSWSAWAENVSLTTSRYVQTQVTATGSEPRLLECSTIITKG